jgi:hypothetical protein
VVEPTEVVGVYTRPQAAVVVICWEARVVGGEMQVTDESLDVRKFNANEIPWAELAFQTTTWALRDWVRLRHPHVDHPTPADDEARWPSESA